MEKMQIDKVFYEQIKKNLSLVMTALDFIEVKGKANLANLLGVINTIQTTAQIVDTFEEVKIDETTNEVTS